MWHAHKQWDFSAKENEIISLAGKWMQPETITLGELELPQKDEQHMLFHVWSWTFNGSLFILWQFHACVQRISILSTFPSLPASMCAYWQERRGILGTSGGGKDGKDRIGEGWDRQSGRDEKGRVKEMEGYAQVQFLKSFIHDQPLKRGLTQNKNNGQDRSSCYLSFYKLVTWYFSSCCSHSLVALQWKPQLSVNQV